MLKVGLVGVGGISGAHIPAWEKMEDVIFAENGWNHIRINVTMKIWTV